MFLNKRTWIYALFIACIAVLLVWGGMEVGKHLPPFSLKTKQTSNFHFIKVGVIDVHRVKRDSSVFQRLSKLVADKHQQFYDEITKLETKLRTEHELLVKKSQNHPQSLKNHKNSQNEDAEKKAFEKKVENLEKLVQQKKQDLQEFMIEAYGQVEKKVQETIKVLSVKYDYELILDSSLVLYSASNNITQDMIQLLDEKTQNLYNEPSLSKNKRK